METRVCKLCEKPIRSDEPRLMQGPDYWQTFSHERCVAEQRTMLRAKGWVIVEEQ